MKPIVTFGEIMGRFAAPGQLRLRQALPGTLEVSFAGAEANVAASLALLGAPVRFVTALPESPLSAACLATLRGLGIDLSQVLLRDKGRLGLFFLEAGANQRPGEVFYDRDHSTISLTPSEAYDWDSIFADAGWLHVTGITPALSQLAADAARTAVEQANRRGLTVSFDLNFRSKLWRWEPGTTPMELAARMLGALLPHIDLLIAGPGDGALLGIEICPASEGHFDSAAYVEFAQQASARFPKLRRVASTLRTSHSASRNDLGAMLYDAASGDARFAPRRSGGSYEVHQIVDRVGGGDAFAAGLIFALASGEFPSDADALEFATAAYCLAHSIVGDVNYMARREIEALRDGADSGRVVR